jgi:hypothetical protein
MNDAYASQIAKALQQIAAELKNITAQLNAINIGAKKF